MCKRETKLNVKTIELFSVRRYDSLRPGKLGRTIRTGVYVNATLKFTLYMGKMH